MIEERLNRLNSEIKALKSSLPIAGSTIETFFYTKVASKVYPGETQVDYKVRYTLKNPAGGFGITNLYVTCEALASDEHWAQYNPIFLSVQQGYYPEGNNSATYVGSFLYGGFDSYEVRITAAVSSTVPGDITIEFS